MAEKLGNGRCPLCGSTKARVSLSRAQLSVLTCTAPDCGLQIFARSDGADERLRALIVPEAKPAEPVDSASLNQNPAPAAAPKLEPQPEPPPADPAPPPPKPKKKGTGTMFDQLLNLGGGDE